MTEIRDKNVHTFVNELTTVLNLIQKQQKELEKKDKIIVEMAKSWKQDDVRSEEEIIQYFEKKVDCKRF